MGIHLDGERAAAWLVPGQGGMRSPPASLPCPPPRLSERQGV